MNQFYADAMHLFARPAAGNATEATITQTKSVMRMSNRAHAPRASVVTAQTQDALQSGTQLQQSAAPVAPSLKQLRFSIDRAQRRVYELAERFEYTHVESPVSDEFVEAVFGLFFGLSGKFPQFNAKFAPRTLQTAYEVAMVQELFPYAKSLEQSIQDTGDATDEEAQYADALRTYAWLAPIARAHREAARTQPVHRELKYEEYSFQPRIVTDAQFGQRAKAAEAERLNKMLPESEQISADADFLQRVQAQQKAREIKLQELREQKEQQELAEIKKIQRLRRPRIQQNPDDAFDHFLETQSRFLDVKRSQRATSPAECTFQPKITRRPPPRGDNVQILGYEKAIERQRRARLNRDAEDPEQAFQRLRERTQRAAHVEMRKGTAESVVKASRGVVRHRSRSVLKKAQVSVPTVSGVSGTAKCATALVAFHRHDSVARILENMARIFTLQNDQKERLRAELVREFGEFDSDAEESSDGADPYDQLANCQQNTFYAQVRDAVLGQSAQFPLERAAVIDEEDQFFV